MKFRFLLIATLLLQACATHDLRPVDPVALEKGPSLWKLSIGGQRPVLRGILALNRQEQVLQAVVLDGSGLKILSEEIDSEGMIDVQMALPLVEERGLPRFLGRSLYRLFMAGEPGVEQACVRSGLLSTCYGLTQDNSLVKLSKMGPFVMWRGDYSTNNGNPVKMLTNAELKQCWPAPLLRLERHSPDLGNSEPKGISQ